MKTFKEYVEERQDEGFFSRYGPKDYTGWNPRPSIKSDYKPGLLPNQPVHNPDEAPRRLPPLQDTGYKWKTRQPGILPQRAGTIGSHDQDVNDDIVSTWDVIYKNLVDHEPELANNRNFKKIVYNKIKDIASRNGISDPKEIIDILSKDPELGDHISGLSPQQRTGYVRRTRNELIKNGPKLSVFRGEDQPEQPRAGQAGGGVA